MIKKSFPHHQQFLQLFSNELGEIDFSEYGTKLNLFSLRVDSKSFDYLSLTSVLQNAINTYCLSRASYTAFEDNKQYGEMTDLAKRKLRKFDKKGGELGELLLYCFLESHLNAPKILTKLEIKTSSNDYVKGADGIHLLEKETNVFELIFAESKLEADLTSSLTNAFSSVNTFLTRKENNIKDELYLISSNLLKETFTEEEYQFLSKIIKPSGQGEIKRDKSFGFLVTFEAILERDKDKLKLPKEEFEAWLKDKIRIEVEKRYAHIKKKIEKYKLFGYSFYIYVVPFIYLQKAKKDMIEDLKGYAPN